MEELRKYLNKLKKYLVYIIITAGVFIAAGSAIVYSKEYSCESFWTILAMSIQNTGETLLFNPGLTLASIPQLENYAFSNLAWWQKFFMFWFYVASAVIPFIDAFLAFSIIDEFLHLLTHKKTSGRKVLIIGFNERVRSLIENGSGNFKLFLWTEKALSRDEKRELELKGISVDTIKAPLGILHDSQKEQEIFNGFLKRREITDVILLQDSDTANIEYYMALSNCEICREKTIHFHVNVNNFEAKCTLQEYFDQRVADKEQQAVLDLRIFSFPEIQAEVLFHRLPIYQGVQPDQNYKVHLLIAGGRQLSEAMLLHAMNQGVITANNPIYIDVFSDEAQDIASELKDRFNLNYVKYTENEIKEKDKEKYSFVIPGDNADGFLKISVFEGSITSESVRNTIAKKQADEPYTYFIACMDNPDDNLYGFSKLRSTIGKIPSALKIPYTYEMKKYVNGGKQSGEEWNVYLMGAQTEYIRIQDIIDEEEEKKAREYNYKYTELSGVKEGYSEEAADKEWNKNKYYQRQSNRALYDHKAAKVFINRRNPEFKEDFVNFWKVTDEDRGKQFAEHIVKTGKTVCEKQVFRFDMQKHLNQKLKEAKSGTMLDLAMTEHRRFCYFYASEGWGYIHAQKKDETNKLQNCLCTWDTMKTEDYTIDKLAYDVTASRSVSDSLQGVTQNERKEQINNYA